MKKFYSLLFTVVLVCSALFGSAQNSFFADRGEPAKGSISGKRILIPEKYRVTTFDIASLKSFLWSLPDEKLINHDRSNAPILTLPMPDGTNARFRVWESRVQEPELQAKFSEIRTFAGQGIDDRYATIRFDLNPYTGLHAQILSSVSGRIYLDPYSKGNTEYYMSYFNRDNHRNPGFSCGTDAEPTANFTENVLAGPCRGTTLRTYRFALSCTGEYAQAVGGGAAGPTHAAIVTTTNRISGVYEVDLAIRLMLVANNDAVEFLDPVTDPYLNNGGSDLNLITGVINASAIGSAGYDVGHLACTASNAGVAGLGVVCGGSKGRGLTGGLNPVGDAYDIDYVAHEVGHQFNAPHTFNSNTCASTGGSYEPGSGTTIMAYAGICAASENIQPNSDAVFHPQSYDAITNFITTGAGANCGTNSATGNTLPVITAMNNNNVSIPINTPFVLTATATDADGDAITYNWDGWDVGAAGSWPSAATSTTRPLFRTRVSKTTGSRTFPDMRVIVANYPGTAAPSAMDGLRGEVLPTVARAMKFRLTVRDNRAGGGGNVSGGDGCQLTPIFQVNAVGTQPFAVTVPNGGESYAGNSTQTVTWNVVGTDAAPINVANVRITLSTDGGLTYPTELLASTPNDGSQAVTMPATATTTARIRVEAIGNIFFDISNANFSITAAAAGFTLGTPTTGSANCASATNATLTIPTTVVGTFTNGITFTAGASTPAGATVSFNNPVTPGNTATATLTNTATLAPGTYTIPVTATASGASTQNTTISFTINAAAAPQITPPTAQTVCAPATATFTTSSTTPGVTYQWQVSTTGVAGTYTNVSTGTGGTTASYTTPATSAAMNGYAYRVIISNGICSSVTSTGVLLTVNTAAAITTQPANQSACTGGTATFTVVATGTGVTYQWQSSTTGAAGSYTNVATGTGATTASYTTAPVTGSTPTFYQVIVTTTTCPGTVTSNAATLTISTSVNITTAPAAQAVCAPNTATFTVVATGSNLTYQWQVSTAGVGGPFTNVSTGTGGTTASYTTAATTTAMSGYAYQVIVTGVGCGSQTSTPVTLTVSAPPAITTQPANQSACTGGTATFNVVATGTGITYQWQSSTTGAAGSYTNVAGGTGATSASYTTAAVTGTTPTFYQVVIGSPSCGSVTSNAATLTINTSVTITTQPTPQAVCVPAAATFSVVAGGSNLTYQWQVSTTGTAGTFANVTTGTGGTTATYNTGATSSSMNGYAYRVIVSGTGCSSVTSTAVLLTVNNSVSVTANPADQRGCAGRDYTFSVTATGATITYQWEVSVNNGPFVNAPGTSTNATYTVTNAQLSQSGNRYRVRVSSGTCGLVVTPSALLTVGLPATVVLTPTYTPNNNPSTPGVLMSTISPMGNYVYSWTLNGAVVPNTLASTSIPLTADNFGVYQLTVTDVATGCASTSNAVTITANPGRSGQVFIYPNPATDLIQVRYYSADAANRNTMVIIYDNKGARVMGKAFNITGTFGRMDMNVNNLVGGTYHVVVTTEDGKVLASGNLMKR